ncbi:MAG: hypothetical protein FWF76_06470 [Oscillospiraceae bacterium]|nr:hypothetical protein [Oscillospiraceae bacterium]
MRTAQYGLKSGNCLAFIAFVDFRTGLIEIFTENELIILCFVDDTSAHQHRPRKFRELPKGTSHCNFCICSSCNAFLCPWAGHFKRLDTSGAFKARCEKCSAGKVGVIHDCDYYTARKRTKFYKVKKRKKQTQFGIVMRALGEIKDLVSKDK